MKPASKKLERARARAALTGLRLQNAAIEFANMRMVLGAQPGDVAALYDAAKKHTNAQHEVGRAEKAARNQ